MKMPTLRPPTPTRASTLEERLQQCHDEIEALAQDYVARQKAENPSLPEVSIRQMFDNRFGNCKCRAFKLGLS